LFLYPAKVTIKIRFSYPMFIENPSNRSDNRGWIEVITGSMFSGKTEELIPVSTAGNILLLASGVDVVGVDEAQFFDMGLIEVCNKLANGGTRVIVAGLDMDFKGRPFGPIPGLIATAEFVTKVHAICVRCGNIAHHTHRKLKTEKLVVLGEKDLYEPLCRKCYQEALSE